MEQGLSGRVLQHPFRDRVSQYEEWFARNENAYQAELRAVGELVGRGQRSVEIGVGTGRFAAPLGVGIGLDPSLPMIRVARRRAVEVMAGVGESLPFPDASFDLALMVTTVCFLNDLEEAFREARRILVPRGSFVVGFVDRASPLGAEYFERKEESVFYASATFYTVAEVIAALKNAEFHEFEFRQTLFGPLNRTTPDESVKPGYGEGSFVAIKAK
ncbi:MAG: class I SAM-dependent methyltransferase [Gemmatimonadota bacterium]|jgi:SAM-dependent methyltransferase